MEHTEMTAKRFRVGTQWRLVAALVLTTITPELIGVWLFVVAREHMLGILRDTELFGMSLMVVFVAHVIQVPLLGLLWAYRRATTDGRAGAARTCLMMAAILITAGILSRLHVFGMYGMLVPGLLYSISLVLLVGQRSSPDANR